MSNSPKWLRVVAATKTAPASLEIDGIIGGPWWDPASVDAKLFCGLVRECAGKPLVVRVNSDGGSVAAGLKIYRALKEHGNVDVFVEGCAASIASIIALGGARVHSPKGSLWMLHYPWVGNVSGNAEELRRQADSLDKFGDEMVAIYVEETGQTEKEVRRVLSVGESWFTSAEAKEWGLCDDEEGTAVAASAMAAVREPERFKNLPAVLRTAAGVAPAPNAGKNGCAFKNPMKKLHAALLTAGLISADTAEGDDQMAQAFEAGLTALAKTRNDELAGVRAELETAKAETAKAMEKLAARVIDGAVAAKLLKDEPATREAWVKAYALDPAGTEAKLASISAPAPAARGVPASEVGEATSAAEALAAAEAFAKEADPVKRADLWKKHRKAILDCANAARR